ncbi:MAG: biotin--[acetyl-CoA-carboxylase] ligase [Candidatus Limnocylindria bacterium]
MDRSLPINPTDRADWTGAADVARRVGRRIEHHASIGSTNDRAREVLREPGGDGLAVVADLQTAGRGRRGRSWLSPSGANLMVSVPLRTRLDPRAGALLGIATALAVRDACATVAPEAGLAIRWPNDVVAADGAKLAGLLLETALEDGWLVEAVIGIGINTNWRRAEMPAEIAARATSLTDLVGTSVDRVALLGTLLDALDREIAALEVGDTPLPRLRAVSWLDGRRIELDLGGAMVEGRVAGIGDDGSLLLDGADGRTAYTVGEVVRVLDAATAGAPA